MGYTITTAIDYITDRIGKDSASIGAVKKLDVDRILLMEIVTLLQQCYCGTREPASPVQGQIWYDSSVGYHKKYSGSAWSALASAAGISDILEDTSPQLGGFLDLNEFSIRHNPAPTTDHTYNGGDETATAGENLVIGDVCYLKSDGKYWKADADSVTTTAGVIRMASTTIAADADGIFIIPGDGCYVRDDTWNWATIGAELYISVTPGNPTTTAPSGDADVRRIIGHVITADIIEFKVSESYVVLEV